jgi:TetR/AcrR family transcriptional repressor of nem operon
MARPSHRDSIVDAGLRSFHRSGYVATGVAEITAEAGVPKGSFYNHFESKEALAVAALERYWGQNAAVLGILAEDAPATDRVRRHFAAIGAAMAAEGYLAGCFLGNLATEAAPVSDALRARTSELFAQWTECLADCLRHGMAVGQIAPRVPPEQLARFLIAAWEGAVQRAKVERDGRAFAAFQASLPGLLRP